jgi:hypothetical protein
MDLNINHMFPAKASCTQRSYMLPLGRCVYTRKLTATFNLKMLLGNFITFTRRIVMGHRLQVKPGARTRVCSCEVRHY